MKSWAIILSIYITLLAAMPCCVFDNCPDDKATTEQTQHDQGDDDGCGTCSPFFNCGTCNVSFIATSASFDFTPFLSTNASTAHYRSAAPVRISAKIWQPPKIG